MKKFFVLLLSISLIAGCSGGISFDTPLYVAPNLWNQFGASPQRVPVNIGFVNPPLQLLWHNSVNASGGAASPIVSENIVFVPTVTGSIYLFDKSNGKDIGYISVKGSIIGTPAAKDTLLIIATSAPATTLTAVNLNNAKVQWTKEVGAIESSVLIEGNLIYVSTLNAQMYCIGLKDSTTHWKTTFPKPVHSSPTFDGSRIIVGCDNGIIYSVNKSDGKQVWKLATSEAIMAVPIVKNNTLYIGSLDKNFFAINSKTGSLIWKATLDAPIYAAATTDGENIFIGTTGGKLYCLEAKTGKEKWIFQAKSVINSAPVCTETGVIFCSLDKFIRYIDKRTGKELWSFETEGKITASPVLVNDVLIVMSESGDVYAFGSRSEIK